MPVILQCPTSPVSDADVHSLWQETIENQRYSDDVVTVQCVSVAEITRLNATYRDKDKATNVLTFSYGEGEHDIALCLDVAYREAQERGVERHDYVALLLVHAFLHVTGLDHEASSEAAIAMKVAEQSILQKVGFTVNNL